jgi:hypothetical protein
MAEYIDAKIALISSVKYTDENCCCNGTRVSASSSQKFPSSFAELFLLS